MLSTKQNANLQCRLLHDRLLHRIAHPGVLVVGGGVSPADGAGAHHGNGHRRRGRWLCFHFLAPGPGWRSWRTANGKCWHATIWVYDNKAACSYLEDSIFCAFRLRATRRPCRTVEEYRPTPRMVRGSCLYSPPPQLLSSPDGFCPLWTRCRAEPQLLGPSWLRPRR
jgi:hypothetical protein